jgi:hypothetical protein
MNSKEILKFGAQIMLQNLMAAFISVSFYIFFSTFGGLYLIGFLFGLAIYLMAMYIFSWNKGNKDMVKVRFKHTDKTHIFGLMSGLFATIPSILFMVVFYLTLNSTNRTDQILNFIARFWFAPFLYIIMQVQKTPLVYALPVIITVLPMIVWVGYTIGMKDIRLRRKAIYKNDFKFEYPEKDNSAYGILNEKNLKNLKK